MPFMKQSPVAHARPTAHAMHTAIVHTYTTKSTSALDGWPLHRCISKSAMSVRASLSADAKVGVSLERLRVVCSDARRSSRTMPI